MRLDDWCLDSGVWTQYDAPPPDYPVTKICDAIDGLPEGADILSRISAAALNITFRETGCKNVVDLKPSKMSRWQWQWQTCTKMAMPIGYHEIETMFQSNPFDLNKFIKNCQNLFGVTPRPHWITTEFGGHNITSVLKKFASNIIFSNGLRDPYSTCWRGELVTAGSHGLDLNPAKPSDPEWQLSQRQKEIEILDGWIKQ
ncbi:Lysosomal pro-x carboxypeptidase [Thalictrum thalictroides]|uniref:Lysosomal pro-x carboxypeptidase n=1 Tax=Thalictrum thalictroides TaxID=46969 RepID=A0A7J6VM00_THATH|nr:Lysosomal pro-x carboxypeptidase [Thalictrum thalictroides]